MTGRVRVLGVDHYARLGLENTVNSYVVVLEVSPPLSEDAIRELEDKFALVYNVQTSSGVEQRVAYTVVCVPQIEKESTVIYVPPFFLLDVLKFLERHGYNVLGVYEWARETFPIYRMYRVKPRLPPPRPYQVEAFRRWLEARRGIVVLPTGAGKTYVALAAIAALRVPTLIIVPTEALAEQWRENVERHLGVKACVVKHGKPIRGGYNVYIMVFRSAYLYSASPHLSWLENILRKCRLVIIDEVHHMGAETFFTALLSTFPLFVLGLTATPRRSDGNEELMFRLVGQIVYYADTARLVEEGYIAPVLVQLVPVQYTLQERKMIMELEHKSRYLGQHSERKRRLEKELEKIKATAKARTALELVRKLVEKGRRIIVFSRTLSQLEILADMMRRSGIEYAVLTGKEKNIEPFASGRVNVLLCSPAGEEGVDIPSADVAIFLDYPESERVIVQRVGRATRPARGKIAEVYIVYTPDDADKAMRTCEIIEQYFPPQVMRAVASRIMSEVQRKIAWYMSLPRGRGCRVVMPIDFYEWTVDELRDRYPWLREWFRSVIRKRPSDLTELDRRLLLLLKVLTYHKWGRSPWAIYVDTVLPARRVPRTVTEWLVESGLWDIPSLDQPKYAEYVKKIVKLVQDGRIDDAIELAVRESGIEGMLEVDKYIRESVRDADRFVRFLEEVCRSMHSTEEAIRSLYYAY